MKIDKTSLKWAMKAALVEQCIDSKVITESKMVTVKKFILEEATYGQLLNLVYNPDKNNISNNVLESIAQNTILEVLEPVHQNKYKLVESLITEIGTNTAYTNPTYPEYVRKNDTAFRNYPGTRYLPNPNPDILNLDSSKSAKTRFSDIGPKTSDLSTKLALINTPPKYVSSTSPTPVDISQYTNKITELELDRDSHQNQSDMYRRDWENTSSELNLTQQKLDAASSELNSTHQKLNAASSSIGNKAERFIRGVPGKVSNIIDTIRKSPNTPKVALGIIGAVAVATAAYYIYKTKFSAAARSCVNSDNPSDCRKQFKIKAIQSTIMDLKKSKTGCSNIKKRAKCEYNYQKQIEKWENRLIKLSR